MIRIVKSDAQPRLVEVNNGNPFNCVEKNVTCYDLEDTVLIDSQWRPEDWPAIKSAYCHRASSSYRHCRATLDVCAKCRIEVEDGFQAALDALKRKAMENLSGSK